VQRQQPRRPGGKQQRILHRRLRHPGQGAPATFRHAQRRQISVRQNLCLRKDVSQARHCRTQRLAILRHQFSRQPNRRDHGDLLPQYRPKRQFQTIPRPRHPQPRPLGDQPRQQRIYRQMPLHPG